MTATFDMPTREMTPTDRRFVVPTWARSARYGISVPEQFRLVDRVIDGGASVLVMATDERTVHAWIAYDDDVMHYAYVAPELRGMKLASSLIALAFDNKGPASITHAPYFLASRQLAKTKFNPYLLAVPKAA
jgi:hypothetical protein